MAIGARELLWGVVRKALKMCGVSMPSRVEQYDRATRRASVQPQIRERFEDGQVRERPVVASRPVVLPRGDGFGIWFDLAKGDPCVTLVADVSTSGYFETGQPTTPVFGQQHQASDAVVFPGGAPDPEQQAVNGEGQCVVGAGDLTSCAIFSRATTSAPDQAGKAEIRVSVRLDLGGLLGLPTARSTDPVKPNSNLVTVMGKLATAANTLGAGITPAELAAFAAAMGTISERPDAKVYNE